MVGFLQESMKLARFSTVKGGLYFVGSAYSGLSWSASCLGVNAGESFCTFWVIVLVVADCWSTWTDGTSIFAFLGVCFVAESLS